MFPIGEDGHCGVLKAAPFLPSLKIMARKWRNEDKNYNQHGANKTKNAVGTTRLAPSDHTNKPRRFVDLLKAGSNDVDEGAYQV